MKAGIVQELLGVTRPTLLKKANESSIKKTKAGDHIFHWADVAKIYQKINPIKIKNKTISICQNKGGVGKTTSTINLGYLFSCIGKTLIIDLDGQANLSQVFNAYKYDLVIKDILDEPQKINEVITPITDNLHIIPNNMAFDHWKINSNTKRNVQYFLQRALKPIKNNYDFILIDCPPSIDLAFELALNASDYALILLDGHQFSLDGLHNITNKITRIIEEDSQMTGLLNLKILGLAFTRYRDTVIVNQVIETTKSVNEENDYPLHIFETKIRENISIPESQTVKEPIFLHDENCIGSIDYFKLWLEILRQING
ncbi:MAG: ParA family protein [Candidatus Sericytochromatia bacterium]